MVYAVTVFNIHNFVSHCHGNWVVIPPPPPIFMITYMIPYRMWSMNNFRMWSMNNFKSIEFISTVNEYHYTTFDVRK